MNEPLLSEDSLHRIACAARDTYFNEDEAGAHPNLGLIIRDALIEASRETAEACAKQCHDDHCYGTEKEIRRRMESPK